MNVLITGGAGFIGSNLTDHLLGKGHTITVLDNLSRRGADRNLAWLLESHGKQIRFVQGDVRDAPLLREVVEGQQAVFHLAAQVAVTSSVQDPQTDFEINAQGTLNVLEAARRSRTRPAVLYTSTNKVYGELEGLHVAEGKSRYEMPDRPRGIDEHQGQDFHSPYGCSKGAADQYVHDYARIYGVPTVVFRMSCIYGPRQFGNEDQGWVAHFIISWLLGRPLTIYGDGKQVRDTLFVTDLLRAFHLALEHIDQASGQLFNIGGGPANTLSLLELMHFLRTAFGYDVPFSFAPWRPGDQKVYVSDIRKAKEAFRWEPLVATDEGLRRLVRWAQENAALFQG